MDDRLPGTAADRESILSLWPGDRSARRSTGIPLRFVGAPEQPWVLASGAGLPDWAQTLERNSIARWRIGGDEFAGTAHRIPEGDPAYRGVVSQFEAQFGTEKLRQWFQGPVACFQLGHRPGEGGPGFDSTEAFFDSASADYERLVTQNPLDAWLRHESVAFLQKTFRPGERVLEIGCGTGLETIPLAEIGVDVVAVDISRRMLDRLEAKAHAAGLTNRIHPRKLSASALEPVLAEFGRGSFDGAFSNFGALNLDPNWSRVPQSLSDLVRPGGAAVLGIWNRVCLMEMLLYSLALRPSRALSRLRSPVPAGLSRFALPVYAHAPGPFLAAFSPGFELESLLALPVLVPPYDFLPHLRAADRILPLMESADRVVRGRFPFNRLGDHFLARMRRASS